MKAVFWATFIALISYAFWSKYGELVHNYFYPAPMVVAQPIPTPTPTPTPKPRPTATATPISTPTPNLIGRQVEITTKDGETTLSGVIKRQEPDGVVLVYAEGIRKIPFRSMTTADQGRYGYNSEQATKFFETQQLAEIERQKAAVELAQKKQQESIAAAAQHEQQVANQVAQESNKPPSRFVMQKKVTKQVANDYGARYTAHAETETVSENVTVLRRESDGLCVRYDYGNECKIQYYNLPDHVRSAYGFPMSR